MANLTEKPGNPADRTIKVGFSWSGSGATLPERKAAEADLIAALQNLNTIFGGSQFEVVDVDAAPRDIKSVVSIETDGAIDQQKLLRILKNVLGNQEE